MFHTNRVVSRNIAHLAKRLAQTFSKQSLTQLLRAAGPTLVALSFADTRTPFFQDAYVDGVRVQLILGPTGSGKSVTGNLTIAHEQKYGGFTYIFDIGGSYESVVELYGGRVDRIGKDGPRLKAA